MSHSDFLAQRRFDVLDGVRAVSILLVFTAHPANQTFWHIFHGASGVSIFFVLSGFLITSLLLREHTRTGAVDLRAFYIRRLFRIYPLFFLVLGIYCLLILGLGMQSDRRGTFLQHLPSFVLLFPEGSFINHVGTAVPFDGSWSIGIEEKFYLVWPLLGFVLLAALPRWRFAVLVALSAALTVMTFLPGWPQFIAPYAQITYGTLAAVALHHRASYRVLSNAGRPAVLALVVAVIVTLQFTTGEILQSGALYPVYGVLVAIAIVGLVTTRSHRATAVLRSRPMVYIGALSYGLYLIHNFGLNAAESIVPTAWGVPGSFLSTAIGLAGAFAVCHFLHRWFEEPLRKLGVRLAHRRRAEATLPAVVEAEPAPRNEGQVGPPAGRVEAAR
jgi:peptidoglycan/LPS O-acetylase OafA/YrhL